MNKLIIECPEWYQPLLRPISDEAPCGESLEYENDFILLSNELEPRIGAEFGDFVETIEPLNFVKILKQAEVLLKISIDIRLIIIIMRCRLHINGLPAIAEGLQALRYAINEWPDAIFPQLWDEGEYIPFLRTNAFSEFDSSEGLIKELRGKKITLSPMQKITISEFEKAWFGLIDETLTKKQLEDNRDYWYNSGEFSHLRIAAAQLSDLQKELVLYQNDVNPEFRALASVLHLFSSIGLKSENTNNNAEPPIFDEPETPMTVETASNSSVDIASTTDPASDEANTNTISVDNSRITSREEAILQLRKVRDWFLASEPGSPIINLLFFTEHLIGKDFLALIKIIPAELIQKLELDGEKE